MLSQSSSVLTTLRHDVTGLFKPVVNLGFCFTVYPTLQLVGIKLSIFYKIPLLNLIIAFTFHHEQDHFCTKHQILTEFKRRKLNKWHGHMNLYFVDSYLFQPPNMIWHDSFESILNAKFSTSRKCLCLNSANA